MSETRCSNSECTVTQTGFCLLNHQPADECPNRVSGYEDGPTGDTSLTHDEPALPTPEDAPRFPPSSALGVEDVRALMGKEYCRIIGLLGSPGSGKTACLVSLYLLLAHNNIDDFTFADSKSLMALDELSRGARSWHGGRPEQITAHTELRDGRSAGFLHFKLNRKSDCTQLHLLIPDLPGEWSTDLIDNNRTDRLRFLRAADEIWVMVNSQTLIEKRQRSSTIHRTNLLINRIAEFFSPDVPTVRLVVTHLDLGKPSKESLEKLCEHAAKNGIDLSINHIASFSKTEGIPPGKGISDLIAQTVAGPVSGGDFWPDGLETTYGSRNALRFLTGGNF
jgi:hypothetical protein